VQERTANALPAILRCDQEFCDVGCDFAVGEGPYKSDEGFVVCGNQGGPGVLPGCEGVVRSLLGGLASLRRWIGAGWRQNRLPSRLLW